MATAASDPALLLHLVCGPGVADVSPSTPNEELYASTRVILEKYCNKAEMGNSILDVPLGGPGFSYMPYGFQLSQLLEPQASGARGSPDLAGSAWESPNPSPPHSPTYSSCGPTSDSDSEQFPSDSSDASFHSSWWDVEPQGNIRKSEGMQRTGSTTDLLGELLGTDA